MRTWTILFFGTLKTPGTQAFCQHLLKQFAPPIPHTQTLRPILEKNLLKKQEKEWALLCKQLPKKSPPTQHLILFDPKGKPFSTACFASFLQNHASRPLWFAIGSKTGWPKQAHLQSYQTISFSKMTLSHELAYMVCLEQLYRARMFLIHHPYAR